MEVKDSIIENKNKSKNIYFEVLRNKYYVFEPKLEYFGLTDESQDIYDKSIKQLEKAEELEKKKIDSNNKKYSKQRKEFDSKMKISNTVNTCITILFVILTFTNTSSNLGALFLGLSIGIPILIYWCSRKYFESEITYEYLSDSKIDKYKYIDKDLEKSLTNYKNAVEKYNEYINNTAFERTLDKIDYHPTLSLRYMEERAKTYLELIGFTKFEKTNENNIFIATRDEEKFLIWLNPIYDRPIHFMEELGILKGKLTRYPECGRAWMYVNANSSNLLLYADNSGCEVVGEHEVAWYLRHALDCKIFKERCDYYGLNDDSIINGNKCPNPHSFFYPNGNLKYYGDIEQLKEESSAIKHPASNGYGVYLDENENIIKYGYFMKGEITNLDNESIYTPTIQIENDNQLFNFNNAFDFAKKEAPNTFHFEEFIVKTEKQFGYDIEEVDGKTIAKKHNKKVSKDIKVIIYDIKNLQAKGFIIVDTFSGNDLEEFKEIHSSCALAQYLLGHKVGDIVGKDEKELCDWGTDAYLIMQILD